MKIALFLIPAPFRGDINSPHTRGGILKPEADQFLPGALLHKNMIHPDGCFVINKCKFSCLSYLKIHFFRGLTTG